MQVWSQANLVGDSRGGYSWNARRVASGPADSELIDHARTEYEVMGAGQAPIVFRRLVRAGQDRRCRSILHGSPLISQPREGGLQ